MADARQQTALILEEKGSLRPEKEKTTSWPVFWPEEVPHMAVPAKLDELHLRNAAESWAEGAEFSNRRRLPHNSEYNLFRRQVSFHAPGNVRHEQSGKTFWPESDAAAVGACFLRFFFEEE